MESTRTDDDRTCHPAPFRRFSRAAIWRAILIGGAIAGLVLATGVFAFSPLPLRGQKVFGEIVGWVKDHPGGTAIVSLGGVAVLWIGLGIMALVQELSGASRRVR